MYQELSQLFPYDIKPIPTQDQLDKVVEEAKEAKAALGEHDGRIVEELIDVIHAAWTELKKYPPEMVDETLESVLVKNQTRGYYL